MADQGGYRAPTNPAPVSGPGALSRRTDGGPASRKQPIRRLPDAGYGEQKEFRGIQQGAAMRNVPAPIVGAPSAPSGGPAAAGIPLDAPSTRPGEPVTAGADAGAGIGMKEIGVAEPDVEREDIAYLLRQLPVLQFMVDSNPGASTSTRALVRFLRSQV